jgi:hypothetical protein
MSPMGVGVKKIEVVRTVCEHVKEFQAGTGR